MRCDRQSDDGRKLVALAYVWHFSDNAKMRKYYLINCVFGHDIRAGMRLVLLKQRFNCYVDVVKRRFYVSYMLCSRGLDIAFVTTGMYNFLCYITFYVLGVA